jgi:Fe-S-cluster containining protein
MTECKCESCSGACGQKPGWFLPGEPEKLAEYLGISLRKLFRKKLSIDFWCNRDATDVFIVAPATVKSTPGAEYPFDPYGRCVFLTDEGDCEVHEAKPFECKAYMHGDSKEKIKDRKKQIVSAWKENQRQIEKLLGRPPTAPKPDIFDVITKLAGKHGIRLDSI